MFNHNLEQMSFVQGIAPVADFLSGTVDTDAVNMKNFSLGLFIVQLGAGATGQSTITLQACDNLAKANPTPIPFTYRTCDSDGQNMSDYQQATSSGALTPTGGGKVMLISFQADHLTPSKPCAFLRGVEEVDSPVAGGILFIGQGGRYQQRTPTNPSL